MNYTVTHKTVYTYNTPVSLCHNIARLLPRSTDKQTCTHSSVVIDPVPDVLDEYVDFFGNKLLYFAIQQEHKKLVVTVTSDIDKTHTGALEINLYSHTPWEQVQLQYSEPGKDYLDIRQYIPETAFTTSEPAIVAYAQQSFKPGISLFDAASNLMQRIYSDFEFKPGFTTIATPLSEVMKARKGVCQDFAHLAIACVRAMGLPARYVSGYIETLPPKGTKKLVGVDASHAWFSVYIPNMGWVDFDPTNNQLPANQHITVGWGRDYADVAPLKGIIVSSGRHQLSVSVDVRRNS